MSTSPAPSVPTNLPGYADYRPPNRTQRPDWLKHNDPRSHLASMTTEEFDELVKLGKKMHENRGTKATLTLDPTLDRNFKYRVG
jgi:hypothetical protein